MLKLRDIASHAGVSPTTVSVVLNDRHETLQISEKTRLKVLQAAEELGYRTNHMARAMRTGNTRMLGILGGKASEEQVGQMLEGALEAADAQGYTLKILRLDSVGNSAQQVIRRCSELRLMGVVALHLHEHILEELHLEAQKFDTPLVLLDARSSAPGIVQVISDDEGGIVLGVEHLIALGHTKIAFIAGEDKTRAGFSSARREAFIAVMAQHGLTVPPDYIQEGAFRFREPSVRAARALLSLPTDVRPTAIFCAGDLMALATLQVAGEFGLSVPRDLSVMGFANMMVSEYGDPPLTTINQPFEDMGRAAVDVLLNIVRERMQEDVSPDSAASRPENQSYGERADQLRKNLAGKKHSSPPETSAPLPGDSVMKLPTQLIERQSTAPPPTC